MITRQALDERLARLISERELIVSQLGMYDGGIQECRHWLSQLEDEAGTTPASDPSEEQPCASD